MYYVNDGVYGSFNCLIFDHAKVTPKCMDQENVDTKDNTTAELYNSTIWGPTCDSMDIISKEAELPELQCGDWLYFENMGAYTSSASSEFNGMKRPCILYVNSSGRGSLDHSLEWFRDGRMGN